jgi:hypothetical protein
VTTRRMVNRATATDRVGTVRTLDDPLYADEAKAEAKAVRGGDRKSTRSIERNDNAPGEWHQRAAEKAGGAVSAAWSDRASENATVR